MRLIADYLDKTTVPLLQFLLVDYEIEYRVVFQMLYLQYVLFCSSDKSSGDSLLDVLPMFLERRSVRSDR